MPAEWVLTLVASALVMVVLYRRARRLFGRQRFSRRRLGLRLAVIGGISILLFVLLSIASGFVPVLGLAAGAALGLLGLSLTRFETLEGDLYFKPNGYVGLAVLSLFLGRMVYRLATLQLPPTSTNTAGVGRSPTTVAIIFVILGFYLCYYASVLIRGWRLTDFPTS